MEYVVSILVLAVVMTLWGYCFSKWRGGRGGCGCCSSLPARHRDDSDDSSCCQTGSQPSCPTQESPVDRGEQADA